ncbi:MAG TPA: hypothetical protein VMR21_03825 [Vicinamibacteria bacterium]|nr:hypothetical protein [Vicinamibacteria bacterium]
MSDFVLTPAERSLLTALDALGVRYLLVGMGAALLEGAQGTTPRTPRRSPCSRRRWRRDAIPASRADVGQTILELQAGGVPGPV